VTRIPQGVLGMLLRDAPELLARDAPNHAAVMAEEGATLAEWVLSAPDLLTASDRLEAGLGRLFESEDGE
jgi:hypothetical protein